MSFKLKLFLLFLSVILITSLAVLYLNKKNPYDQTSNSYKYGVSSEIDNAISKAQELYREKKENGEDLSSGPCLSNDLMPGWVADIAHNPRIASDNLPQNQCAAYLEGRAKHFVELDLDGKLIRVH